MDQMFKGQAPHPVWKLETERHVPLDRQKSMPAWPLITLEASTLVSQPRSLAYLASWKGRCLCFVPPPRSSNWRSTGSNHPPWEIRPSHDVKSISDLTKSHLTCLKNIWLSSSLSSAKQQRRKQASLKQAT